jgi:hypothetical protein
VALSVFVLVRYGEEFSWNTIRPSRRSVSFATG